MGPWVYILLHKVIFFLPVKVERTFIHLFYNVFVYLSSVHPLFGWHMLLFPTSYLTFTILLPSVQLVYDAFFVFVFNPLGDLLYYVKIYLWCGFLMFLIVIDPEIFISHVSKKCVWSHAFISFLVFHFTCFLHLCLVWFPLCEC